MAQRSDLLEHLSRLAGEEKFGVSLEKGVRVYDEAAPMSSHNSRDSPGKGEASAHADQWNRQVCLEVSTLSWEVSKPLSRMPE